MEEFNATRRKRLIILQQEIDVLAVNPFTFLKALKQHSLKGGKRI